MNLLLNVIFFLGVILLNQSGYAGTSFDYSEADTYYNSAQTGCFECQSASSGYNNQNQYQTQNNELKQTTAEIINNLSKSIVTINSKFNFSDSCHSFAQSSKFGKWGSYIIEEMRANDFDELYRGTSDIVKVCPAFPQMEDGEKEALWVLIINAMSNFESSCDPGEKGYGPNGSLIGLLQLHRGKENKYSHGCQKLDGKSPRDTFRCGLSMLNDQIQRDGLLFSPNSYWDVLRPAGLDHKSRKIRAAIKAYEACH